MKSENEKRFVKLYKKEEMKKETRDMILWGSKESSLPEDTFERVESKEKDFLIWSEWHLSYINTYCTMIQEESPFGKNEGSFVCNIYIIAFSNMQAFLWFIEYKII